jgi:hypothetical protein
MGDVKRFYYEQDVAADTYIFRRIHDPLQGPDGVKTTAAGVTIVAYTSGTKPFRDVYAGDIIMFQPTGDADPTVRKVATKVSDDEITISGANVDYGAGVSAWWWMPNKGGTAEADGARRVSNLKDKVLHIKMATVQAAAGIGVKVMGRGSSLFYANWSTILPEEVFANGSAHAVVRAIEEDGIDEIAVGIRGVNGFAGTDSVSIWLEGRAQG